MGGTTSGARHAGTCLLVGAFLGALFTGDLRVAAVLLALSGLGWIVCCRAGRAEPPSGPWLWVVALALRLANDPQTLAAIRNKLTAHRLSWPLFDTDRFRRHIEAAYLTVWRRTEAGLPAESFSVPEFPGEARQN